MWLFLPPLLLGACGGEPEPPAPAEPEAPSCADLPCLIRHEGQTIDLRGIHLPPEGLAFAVHRLLLEDGTTLVLAPEGALRDRLDRLDRRRLRIRGRIFTGAIPDRYRIIGRTPEPWLVDLVEVEPEG